MFVRGNQIESKPQSVLKCAKGSGEVIPATTVYKPLLLSYLIGLQFIYSGITLIYLFFWLVFMYMRFKTSGADCSEHEVSAPILYFTNCQSQVCGLHELFFRFKQTLITHLYKTHSLAVLEVRIMSRLHTGHTLKPDQMIFLFFFFLPKTVAAAPKFQVQTSLFNGIWL